LEETSGGHLVQPSAQGGPPTAGCPGPCPAGFSMPPRMEIPPPLWVRFRALFSRHIMKLIFKKCKKENKS